MQSYYGEGVAELYRIIDDSDYIMPVTCGDKIDFSLYNMIELHNFCGIKN